MAIKRDIRHVRQDRADLDAQISALRAEGRTLLGPIGVATAPAHEQRLAAIDADLTKLTAKAAEITEELARFERYADDERNSGDPALRTGDRASSLMRPPGRKFAEMFPDARADMGGWSSPSEFLAVVGRGLHDPRLFAAAMSTGDGPAGGYAVPAGILGPWLDQSLESEIVRSRATTWPMTSDTRTVPAWDLMDRSGDDVAGFEIQWTPELGDINLQVSKTRKIKLVAKKGAILAEASEELRNDGLDFDAQLNMILVKALSYGMDRSFLRGTGSGQPLGVLNSPGRVIVAKETNQTAGTIAYENLVKMFSRMHPASVLNSVWVATQSAIPQLLTLFVSIGVGGERIPAMTESNGQFRILSRPVIFTEKLPTLGTEGDIMLADFGQYTIGMRQDVTIDRSAHVGFARDAMTYRLKVRIDGQPNISTPYTPPNSAPTLSPFVVLATRG